VVEGIKNFAPDIVFLCLGAPKQESWFMEWRDLLPDGVYIGAGAAVDFAAGVSTRAPAQLQRLGMEWVWRLAQEPKRLAKRYLIKGPRFLVIAARSIANRGK
jgi:N-acetylglucosaminyldiphosphoundecaprenol N-acetyl-beta-D-mannosaminyltransferase